jgi:hypothetical protein
MTPKPNSANDATNSSEPKPPGKKAAPDSAAPNDDLTQKLLANPRFKMANPSGEGFVISGGKRRE